MKKRGLIGLQFCRAGKASGNSQLWQKTPLHGGAGARNRTKQRGKPVIKPSDLPRTHYHENRVRETTPRIQLPPPVPSPHVGIITVQGKIWVGQAKPNHILHISILYQSIIFFFFETESCSGWSAVAR